MNTVRPPRLTKADESGATDLETFYRDDSSVLDESEYSEEPVSTPNSYKTVLSVPEETNSGRTLDSFTSDDIIKYSHLPLFEASIHIGVEMVDLRHVCRKLGFSNKNENSCLERWPYSFRRTISSISNGFAIGIETKNNGMFSHYSNDMRFKVTVIKKSKKIKECPLDDIPRVLSPMDSQRVPRERLSILNLIN